MIKHESSSPDFFYSSVTLPLIPPLLTERLLDGVLNESEHRLHVWGAYIQASAATKALMRSIITLNVQNFARHSKYGQNEDSDANRIARGNRPQVALTIPALGVDSVELLAKLVSTDDEPHNAMSTAIAATALRCMLRSGQWEQPFGNKPRTRLKVTRLFPDSKETFAVVQTKHDELGLTHDDSEDRFEIKSRRTGYVKLSAVTPKMRDTIVELANSDEALGYNKKLIAEYLRSEPDSYSAVVDRAYAIRKTS